MSPQQLNHFAEYVNCDDMYLDVVSPPFQSCDDEIRKIVAGSDSQNEGTSYVDSVVPSFEILREHGSGRLRINTARDIKSTDITDPNMSIQMIIELAAEIFIQSTSKSINGSSILSHQYPCLIMSGHSEEVQLLQDLLSCADQVRDHMYQRATKILHRCHRMSSSIGTPVQRLVFYFTEALYEKIDRETGRMTPKGLGKKHVDPLEMLKCTDSVLISFHKKLPISQITKFVGVQAIVDHVEESSKVHVIDLEIRFGIQWTILMQALVERTKNPISSLKITAMGSESNKTALEETGRRLTGFAHSLNLNFSFKVVVVADMLDLSENLFELDDDEAVAVFAPYTLTSMIG